MQHAIRPSDMSPEERRAEVGAILAAGYLKLHKRGGARGKDTFQRAQKPLDLAPPQERSCVQRNPLVNSDGPQERTQQ